ncbi:MAG: cytochrome c4 [Chromatiales bacterium]|nr:MAG: cytochrome c4 [Chromatiales bacterium]
MKNARIQLATGPAGLLGVVLLVLAGCGGPDGDSDTPGSAGPAATAAAVGSAEAGRQKSVQCLGCHGAFGMSENVSWPNLAGQSVDYVAKQLRDYRAGRREDPWMSQMAVPLSDTDIADLAAYFSQLEGLGGDPATPIIAAATCAACHSARAVATNASWPALTGQNERYLVQQLEDYRAGARSDPVMAPLAQALPDEDVVKIAAHFANR